MLARTGPTLRSRFDRAVELARAQPLATGLSVSAWMAYAAYQFWIVFMGPIGYWNDTIAYVAVARAPFPSVALFAGQRPPLVPLVWKLTGTPLSFALLQTAVGVLAWTVLSGTVASLVPSGWPRLLAGASVLAFASCWQVTEWSWNVLSESLALSATAVICAATIWLAHRFTLPRCIALLAACAVFAFDRDQAIWVIGPTGIVLIAWAALRGLGSRRHRLPPVRGLLLLGLSLVALASLAELGAESSHRNVINIKDVFYVRVFPFPARVHWFAEHGMPEGRLVDGAARATPAAPHVAKVVSIDLGAPRFKALDRWFESDGEPTYLEYLVTHPGYDLTAPMQKPELTYNNAGGNLASYGSLVDPNPKAPENHALPLLPDLMFPSWELVLGLFVLATVILVIRRCWRPREFLAVGALVVSGLLAMLTAWHGDGMEIARHTLEGSIQARLGVLILMVLAILGPGTRLEGQPPTGD